MSRLNGRFNYSFLVPRWNRIGYQPNNESSCPHCECNYSGYFYTDCGDLWAWNDNGEIAYRTREDDEFIKTGYTTHWKYNWQRASLLCTTPKRITNPADNRDDTKQFYGNYVAFQTGDNSCVIFYKRGSGYEVIYSGQYTGRLPSLGTDWHDDYENSTSCSGQWRISDLNSKSVSNITGYTQPDGSVVKVPDLTKTVQEYLDEYAEADAEAAANGEEADKSGRIDFSKPVLRYDYFNGVYSQHTPPIWSYCWEKAGHFGCGEKKSYTKEVYCKKHLIVNDGEESEDDIYD
ncbi:MAG: hypothetical protein LBT89_12500, partial [Planctomycetaceae bacterium]|nr:hypothetical protein [Planctomycetaceae bacterium]